MTQHPCCQCSRTFLSSLGLLFDLPQPLYQLVLLSLYPLLLLLGKLTHLLLVLQLCSGTTEIKHRGGIPVQITQQQDRRSCQNFCSDELRLEEGSVNETSDLLVRARWCSLKKYQYFQTLSELALTRNTSPKSFINTLI